MQKSILDLTLTLLFLAFLVFILKQKNRHLLYYPQSWRAFMLGGVLLVLAGGTNLALLLYQGGHVSASRWQEVIGLAQIFGYVAGGGLVLLGFARWCGSLLVGRNKAAERLRQLACLKSILSVANRGRELDEVFKESLLVLMNIRGYKTGVTFKHTFDSSELALVAHQGVPFESLATLHNLYSENMWYQESAKSQEITTTTDVEGLPEYKLLLPDKGRIRSFACVPIKFRGKMLGLMGIYDSKPDCFSYQEIQFLTSVGEILGLAAEQALTCNLNKRRRDYISAVENMLKINQEAATLEEAFPQISTELQRVTEFEHISLELARGVGQDAQRISIGSSGRVLVDKRAVVRAEEGSVGAVMKSREARIDREADLSEDSSGDPLVRACGIRSRILLPLGTGDSICGVLCLGHKKPNFYSANDAKWLKLFALELSHLVEEQELKEKSEKKELLSRSLYESEEKLAVEEDLKALLLDAAARLASDLPKSFARVTLLSKERDQLIDCATCQIRSEGIDLKKQKRFSLSDLPWHRLALEAKKPMLVNQDDPESVMSKTEARLIMDEKVSSGLLVPLILNDKAVGVVSVGEMRNWDRQPLTQEETTFVKHKANQLCLALEKGILRRSNERLKERLKYSETQKRPVERQAEPESSLSDLSYGISNPLTIIRGAAELLKLMETDLSPEGLRYISNIENGVDRIQETLERFTSSTTEGGKSSSSQPAEEVVSV